MVVFMSEPAFPLHTHINRYEDGEHTVNDGMSLRDYFAAKAMQGELASQSADGGAWHDINKLAAYAYDIADAMLEARGDA